MSLLIGAAGHRYITVVHMPYPGYQVQIPRPLKIGPDAVKVFAGYRYSLDFYLAQAVQWRDVTYRSLYGKPLPKRILHKHQANSSTGLPGISRTEKSYSKTLKSGEVRVYKCMCIVAEVHLIAGHNYERARGSKSRIFSIAKYGEEEALRLAKAWRTQIQWSLEQGYELAELPRTSHAPVSAGPKNRVAQRQDAITSNPTLPEGSVMKAGYDPSRVFDLLVSYLDLTSDRALAKMLSMQPATLSRLRRQILPLGPSVLLRMHEASRISIDTLRTVMGDRRASYRFGARTCPTIPLRKPLKE